jgi:hypothetical protein
MVSPLMPFVSVIARTSLPPRPIRRFGTASSTLPRAGAPCSMTTVPLRMTSSATSRLMLSPCRDVSDEIG